MNSCWKTVNISRELGVGRVYLLSGIYGILSFIFLFLPFSLTHQDIQFVEYELFTVLLSLLVLPSIHNLMHVIPLILFNKKFKGRIRFEFGFWPIFSYSPLGVISRRLAIIVSIVPTFFLTISGVLAGVVFPSQYPYITLLLAVNVGISYKDFIRLNYFFKAPSKCFIENVKDGFDILIKK